MDKLFGPAMVLVEKVKDQRNYCMKGIRVSNLIIIEGGWDISINIIARISLFFLGMTLIFSYQVLLIEQNTKNVLIPGWTKKAISVRLLTVHLSEEDKHAPSNQPEY